MTLSDCCRLRLLAFTVLVAGLMVPSRVIAAEPTVPAEVQFVRDIKPILAKRCFACHGPVQQKSGLRLDTAAALLKGGKSGEVVAVGKPDDSYLLELVTSQEGLRMPPEGEGTPMTADEVDALRRWIAAGAKSTADDLPLESPRDFWSYKLPQRVAVPIVQRSGWVRNPVDAFVAAEHESRGIVPRPDAEPAVLLRRVYLDLIGLPPSRAELQRFLANPSESAYQQVVNDLLSRPEYGERWGRHWMDVWRYSDWYGSRGINQIRYSQRHIWRWRDWIIESLNADKGYDRMIVEMLAGDELEPANPDVLRATGFLGRNWYKFDRNVWMFETVEQTSQAFLGLTLKCCRCHDHKYDPIEQKDYYRFRAFFEPHEVRTDRLSMLTPTENDTALPVLKDGIARVYDKQLDVPTYLFSRGDDRSPEKSEPLSPAVPPALGNGELQIQAVALPVESFYPALRPEFIAEQLAQSAARVTEGETRIAAVRSKVTEAELRLAALRQAVADGKSVPDPVPFLAENFAAERPEVWKKVSGEWVYENGRLVEKQVTSFATLVSVAEHPRDFRARVRYRTLAPGTTRSVGFSFDYLDAGNSQDVYTATSDAAQSVQAFHRDQGKQAYPTEGIVPTPLKVGDETTVEVVVRGAQLQIRLNGEPRLDYLMPLGRRNGKFALWVHNGSAEFLEVDVRALAETPEELARGIQAAANQVGVETAQQKILNAEHAALAARIAAEQAKYATPPDARVAELGLAASRAERLIAVAAAERELLQAEQLLAQSAALTAETKAAPAELKTATATMQRDAALQKLQTAQAAADKPDGTYAVLGEMFPRESTGRRLALARWIADRRNPRTARVAVNHIWLRHFGAPLAPSVANFGMNGKPPSHPALLDWLSIELMEQGWSMKHLHRLLVTSHAYRLSSAAGADSANQKIDPENIYLWRMNSRRMEAEVVRDSLLEAAGSLDRTRGGPEIAETLGQSVLRRSVYFRNTPNEKMQFLELFDVANPNACYRRVESVVPNQALAMTNSELSLNQSRQLAAKLTADVGSGTETNAAFIAAAFEQILTRPPTAAEQSTCGRFLGEHAALVQQTARTAFPAGGAAVQAPAADPVQRARENLLHVLFSHNDFVTIR